MDESTFHTDHWRHIGNGRAARYERMFQRRDGHARMLEPLDPRSAARVFRSKPGSPRPVRLMANCPGPVG